MMERPCLVGRYTSLITVSSNSVFTVTNITEDSSKYYIRDGVEFSEPQVIVSDKGAIGKFIISVYCSLSGNMNLSYEITKRDHYTFPEFVSIDSETATLIIDSQSYSLILEIYNFSVGKNSLYKL